MTNNEASTSDVNQISCYRDKALTMMSVCALRDMERFHEWINRFEYVANIIHVPRDKMVEFFITMVNDDIHRYVEQRVLGFKIQQISYEEIMFRYSVILNKGRYDVYSIRLMCRNQYVKEPIKHYANCLRKIGKKCVYEKEIKETKIYEKLRTRFFYGLREDVLRTHLGVPNKKTFDEMVAMTIEFAKANLITYYLDHALLKIDIYSKRKEGEFYIWLNKFEFIAKMINVPYSKMVDFFSNMVINDIHKCVKKTFPYVNFLKLPYDEIINHYLRCFSPNEVDLHKPRIFCRKQYERETIANYARNLRKLFNKCIDKTDLEKQLFEHFIYGLRENEVRNHLLETNYESFDEMVAKAIEFAKVHLITYYRDKALLKIDIYNEEMEGEFDIWLNKFEYVADTIDVPESKMVKLFIEMVDTNVNQSVMQANSSVDLYELSYDEIIDHYLRFFFPNEKHLHRSRLEFRDQYEYEPIEYYAFRTLKLIYKCDYPINIIPKLFNRFFIGLREITIQNYLNNFFKESPNKKLKIAIEFEKVYLITYYRDQALLIIDTYNLKDDCEFYVWLNKFEYVASLIDVPNKKMVDLFKEMIDSDVHTCVKQTFPNVDFSQISYDDIINHYLRYFYPNEVELHRPRIFYRKQYERETIERYAYNLRKLFNKCIFTIDLERKLFEQFINGLRENELRNYLRQTNYESFDEIVTKAIEFAKVNLISYYRDRVGLKIQDFFSERRNYFYTWLNRFEYIANMINVPESKMVELFNKMVDNDVHMRVKETLPNVTFSELQYEEIINHYIEFFSTENDNFHSKRIWMRIQYEQETIQNYAYNLQKLFHKISYSSKHEKELIKHFINGLREHMVRKHLSETYYESFDDMVEKANEFAKSNLLTYYRDEAFLEIETFAPEDDRVFHIWLNKFESVADRLEILNKNMVDFFQFFIHNNVQASVQLSYPNVNFSELSYDEIKSHYICFFSSERNNVHIKRFLSRNQYEYELIEKYVDCLRKLIFMCNLKRNVNDDLCVRFCSGLRNNFIKNLLTEGKYKLFEDMVARAIELSKIDLITYYRDLAYLNINIYNPRKEGSFYIWLNKFEYVANILRVPNDKMFEFFNIMVHDEVHASVKKKYSSSDLSKLPYDLLIEYYSVHFASPREVDFYRIRFMSRNQYKIETVQDYANNLEKLYNKCYFTSGGENQLCSRYINGIRDMDIKTFLIQSPNLSFEQMVGKAVELEMKKNELWQLRLNELLTINPMHHRELLKKPSHTWLSEWSQEVPCAEARMVQFET